MEATETAKTQEEIIGEYELLANELIYAHLKWTLFQDLFGTEENVDTLNAVSGGGWSAIQDTIVDAVILSVAKLYDPAGSGKRANLSIERLVEVGVTDAGKQADLTVELARGKVAINALLVQRNKRIAHSDLAHKKGETKYPPVTLKDIAEALKITDELMHAIGECIDHSFATFEAVTDPMGTAMMLYQRAGVAVMSMEREVAMRRMSPQAVYARVCEIVGCPLKDYEIGQ